MKRVWCVPVIGAAAFLASALPAAAQETELTAAASDSVRQVTLGEAIRIARALNPELRISETNIDVAEYNRLDAWGNFLPRFDAGFGYSNSSTGRLDQTGQAITTTSYFFQLTGSYDLFEGFRKFTELNSAQLDLSAQQARYRQDELGLILAVRQAFYDALAFRDLVAVEQDRVERQQLQLEFVTQQLELGRSTRSDVLRSQVDLNNARIALLNAENQLRASTFALGRTLGLEGRVGPAPEATLDALPLQLSREEIYRIGLRTAPAVVSAEASAEAAASRVSTAKSAYLPNLSFRGGWAWANQDFPPQSRSWSIALTGSYPLFNGFQRESNVYRAQAAADAAASELRAEELQLVVDLDAAYNAIQVAVASIELAEQSVELSREDLRVSSERYRLGLATILDLQTAQIAVSQAEVDLIRRRFEYQIGVASLESLLGRTLQELQAGAP
ncbi:MAG: TolC family protein [Gemmatimonadota bacterium]|nr:MAG: TolC family protein [Gemmatimonadota bacterium]